MHATFQEVAERGLYLLKKFVQLISVEEEHMILYWSFLEANVNLCNQPLDDVRSANLLVEIARMK